ncbi:MAG: helix-turn-helix transcriptional regulator [Clostridia bacterium]|nr:helix-turn-helix transcriptional regulator [Clostridia bacterium]
MPPKKELPQLGQRLRDLRLRLGLTQEQLAERANLHYSYIGQVERGEKTPSLRALKRLAKAMHTSVDFFLEEQSPYDPQVDSLRRELLALVSECPAQDLELIVTFVRLLTLHLRQIRSPVQEV